MDDKTIRVLSVCTSDSVGGAGRAAYRIHQGVQRLGVNSSMFVKEKRSSDSSVHSLGEFIPDGKFYRAVDWVAKKVKNKLQHLQWNRYPEREKVFMSDMRSTRISNALTAQDYNILHLHWTNLRFFPLAEMKRINKPIVWTLHDSWPFCGVCHYFLDCERYKDRCGRCPSLHSGNATDLSNRVWRKKKEIYKDLDLHVVAPSKWLAECARNSSLFKDFPVTVIPNCIETDVFRPLLPNEISERWNWLVSQKQDKKYLLFGAMNATTDKIKGFAILLSSLTILASKYNSKNIELIIFGDDKPLDGILESIPTHYVGYVSDVEEMVSLYNIADVTVVPSLTENLSCTIMESMSCGTPVVAFETGGNGDMIDHKQSGYLAHKMDETDLAEGLIWCLDHVEECNMSVVTRNKVLRNYTPAIVCEQYKKLYTSIGE